MRHPPRFVIAPLLLSLLLTGQVHGASPDSTPASADIEKAIHELGAVDYHTRERANEFLRRAGPATEKPLRKALASDDPEVRERARAILDNLDYLVGPDTPTAVIDAIAQYKAGNHAAAIQQLATLSAPGIRALLSIRALHPNDEIQLRITQLITVKPRDIVPDLITANENDIAGQVLELCATTGEERHIRAHAAWLLIRGGLKDRIAQLKAIPAPDPAALLQLVYLYRADGDLTNALDYAVRLSDPDLTRRLRYELSDWKALATDPGGEPGIERLGFQAAYYRLSANMPAFGAALTNIHTYAEQHRTKEDAWYVAEAFLINDRPRDAGAALTRMGRYELAYQILRPWGHEDEASRILSLARLAKSDELPALERAVAEKLTNLGSTNEARAIIANLIANTTITTNEATYGLIGTTRDIGLIHEAATLAARALGALSAKQVDERNVILRRLFPKITDRAAAWLLLLRETSTEGTLAEHLARLLEYFAAKPEAQRAFISLADKAAPAIQNLPSYERMHLWQSLADAHKCLKETNRIVTCERRACDALENNAASYRRLALALANALQWPEAAAAARRANEIQPAPASLWASGWALAKAGDEKAGREAMDRANLQALASEEQRSALIEVMEDYGAKDASVLQQWLILRLGRFKSWENLDCLSRLAALATQQGDFTTATEMGERHDLQDLHKSTTQDRIGEYARNCYLTAMPRILGNLGQGRLEEAMEQARHQQEHWPCENDLPMRLGPALEKAGRKDLADQLFATTFTNWSTLLRQYPNFVLGHNYMAWLSARMRRELPAGLEHARKAIELSPDLHWHRDTLAELLFQLGRREEAVAEMRKCVGQAPDRQYYRRQLKRMQEGDPATDPSKESD